MSNALRIAHGPFGRVALLDMSAPLVRHAHPHCHVLLKAEGADTQFVVGDRAVPLTDASAVLVDAWVPHAYAHDPARPRTIILALYIEPAWLGGFRANWTASAAPGFFGTPGGTITPRIRRLAAALAEAMLAGLPTEAPLAALMIAVIERFAPWREPASLRDRARAPDHRIRRAVTRLRAEPGATDSMARLAREVGLSRAHFFRRFEADTGVTPRVFRNVVRLERAVRALVEETTPLAELGERLGFASPPHFSRFFRDHAGACPSEFRAVARRGALMETPG